jgi:hypothetical protein
MISLKYEWEYEYVAAIMEEDNAELRDLISSAELAIASRLDVLKKGHATAEEIQAIVSALSGLEKLRLDRLGEGRTKVV